MLRRSGLPRSIENAKRRENYMESTKTLQSHFVERFCDHPDTIRFVAEAAEQRLVTYYMKTDYALRDEEQQEDNSAVKQSALQQGTSYISEYVGFIFEVDDEGYEYDLIEFTGYECFYAATRPEYAAELDEVEVFISFIELDPDRDYDIFEIVKQVISLMGLEEVKVGMTVHYGFGSDIIKGIKARCVTRSDV